MAMCICSKRILLPANGAMPSRGLAAKGWEACCWGRKPSARDLGTRLRQNCARHKFVHARQLAEHRQNADIHVRCSPAKFLDHCRKIFRDVAALRPKNWRDVDLPAASVGQHRKHFGKAGSLQFEKRKVNRCRRARTLEGKTQPLQWQCPAAITRPVCKQDNRTLRIHGRTDRPDTTTGGSP